MPLPDFLAQLFGVNNDPYEEDREALRRQLLEQDPYYSDREALKKQLLEYRPLEQYSGPTLIDERAKAYRDAYGDVTGGLSGERGRIEVKPLGQPSGFEATPLGQDLLGDTSKPPPSWFSRSPLGKMIYGEPLPEVSAPDIRVEELKRGEVSPDEEQTIAEKVVAPSLDDYPPAPEYDPAEYLRSYADNMDPDKLARIRAQAVAKGRRGSLEGGEATGEDFLKAAFGGGGSFSQAEESPELTQRLAERDAWAAQQPMRDALWDIDVARQRGDTAGQDSAAGRLQSLQQQALAQSKQDAINSLLANVTDKTGKIDPDTYQKLGMLGQYVPSSMVGKSKEQTLSEFDSLIASGSETISQLAPQAMFDPSGEIANRVAAERKGVQLLTQLKQMVASGQMTGEEASAMFQQAMMMDKYVQGWISEKMMVRPGQNQQGE